MDDRLKNLWADLEAYIQENWIASEEEIPVSGVVCGESPVCPSADRECTAESDDWEGWGEEAEVLDSGQSDGAFSKDMVLSSYAGSSISLEDLIGEVGEPFHEVLFERIAQSGMSDVEVYRRANMDRKLFSKIRSNPAYHPGKNTVLALAIALRMDMDDTQDLLSRAEYAMSPSSKSDVIIRYFIERKIFDIDLINIALDDHGLAILG